MAGDTLVRDAPPEDAGGGPVRTRKGWRRRPWIIGLAVVTVAFLAFALPPYLGLDPGQARLPVDRHPLFYPVLVTHIFAGAVLLGCGVLQLWPWLRNRHRRVHRWTGRLYVIMAIPTGLGALFVAQFPAGGPTQQVANTLLALLLLGTTAAGFRAVRQRRFADHREWMIRSFGLAFSIVTNRLWMIACLMIFAPNGTDPGDPVVQAAVSPSAWLSWVVNLLIVEWWILRRRRRPERDRAPGRDRSLA